MTDSTKALEAVPTAVVDNGQAKAQPTQVRRPWRSTVRTVFQALIALAAMWALIVEALGLPDWAWVTTSLAVAAGITRVMALPAVEVFLRRFVPWLAAAPSPASRQRR